MAYNAKAQKKYRDKSIQLAVNYRPGTDIQDGERIKAYLDKTGQSANSYIKGLIKADLDAKGFNVNDIDSINDSDIVDADTDSTDLSVD